MVQMTENTASQSWRVPICTELRKLLRAKKEPEPAATDLRYPDKLVSQPLYEEKGKEALIPRSPKPP